MGGLHITVLPFDSEEAVPHESFSASKSGLCKSVPSYGENECIPHGTSDLLPPPPTPSYKTKLPAVLEESESPSHTEASSTWDTSTIASTTSSSSSLSSITSSSTSSTSGLFQRRGRSRQSARNAKLHTPKKISFMSMILWPLKKVRDGYMSCMMSLDGAGDLSGISQGANFATSTKYFPDPPLSKTDSRNHG